MNKILLVDDERSILVVLDNFFKANNYEVVTESDGEKALQRISEENYDLMISDIRMSPIDGIQLLEHARKERPEMPVIMLTAYGSRENAERAMKMGAFGYLMKPFNLPELLITVKRALTYNHPPEEQPETVAEEHKHYSMDNIVAESVEMKALCEKVAAAGMHSDPVLICGESGSGKRLFARVIHAVAGLEKAPFVERNCAVLPEPLLDLELFGYVKGAFRGSPEGRHGVFEEAHAGSVLLDEISWMPRNLQAKLAGCLERKAFKRVKGDKFIPLTSRLIATADTFLQQIKEEGSMLDELFAVLTAVDCLEIPPLRERRADIMPLVYHFIEKETGASAGEKEIDSAAVAALEGYTWPHNVDELETVIKNAVKASGQNVITKDLLPEALQ